LIFTTFLYFHPNQPRCNTL